MAELFLIFHHHILKSRLQSWHMKCYDKILSTDEDKYMFACYSGFFAEIFSKIRVVCLYET